MEKIKPIFNVGDFIINGDVTDYGKPEVFRVEKICDTWYDVENIYDGKKTIITFMQNDSCRPWSIEDAKEGDILASKSGKRIFSYSGRLDLRDRPCAYYGIYETYDGFILTKCAFGNFFTYEEVYPATRDQHNFLLRKMQEANWSWDISSNMKLGINTRGKDVVIFSNEKTSQSFKQNHTWSEEDEEMFINALDMVEWYGGEYEGKSRDVSDWIKSLKQRIKGNG